MDASSPRVEAARHKNSANRADHGLPSPALTPPPHAMEFSDTASLKSISRQVTAKPISRTDRFRQFAASQGFTPLEHYMYLRMLKGDGKLWEAEYSREDEYGDATETQGVLQRLEH